MPREAAAARHHDRRRDGYRAILVFDDLMIGQTASYTRRGTRYASMPLVDVLIQPVIAFVRKRVPLVPAFVGMRLIHPPALSLIARSHHSELGHPECEAHSSQLGGRGRVPIDK